MNGYPIEAYSMLGTILARQNLSVSALQRRLAEAGVAVNIKSLYRLADDALQLRKVDMQIAGAVCRECNVGLGDLITLQKPQARLGRLDTRTQARLDELMEKNNEGKLTAAERREFDGLAERAHQISMENARTLLAERRRTGRTGAVKGRAATSKRAAIAA